MKAILTGVAVMVLIAIGAYAGLNQLGFSSEAQHSGAAVRLN